MKQERRVEANGVSLHVVEAGTRGRPPVLLVHGFPDCHEVYSDVLDDLARDFHVATFDLRGVARSTAPESRSGYRIDAVLPDLTAVIDAVFGTSASVHLVGHDWGSVLCFSYVTEGPDRHRIRSFTSASGPHVRLMWDSVFHNARSSGVLGAISQALASWYVFALHLPAVPELLFRFAGRELFRSALARGGVPTTDAYLDVTHQDVVARTHGPMNLYRQNALRPPAMPAKRSITVPIHLLVPLHDPFVRPEVFTHLGEYATDLVVTRVEASHWLPRSHPTLFAEAVRSHARSVDERHVPAAQERT